MADLRSIYESGMQNVQEIDTKLDSLTDQETAGKRKVSNDLIEATRSEWEGFLASAVKQMENMEPEILSGVYLALQRGLKDKFDAPTNEFITTKVADMPPVQPLISEDEAEELRKVRSNLYQQVKSVRELALQIGEATEDDPEWKMPKMRRGAHGKRGKRALSYYEWFFNGEEIEDVNTVRDVAAHLGYSKAADFTAALREAGIDTRNPPTPQFEFNHPSGVVVTAVREEDENGDEDEDTEDIEDEDVEDSEETPDVE
jgi:hypothetical protein